MPANSIGSSQLQEILVGGATRLARLRKDIDRLNVFPVPDGDTGTNMYLTLMAALQEMDKVSEDSIGAVSEAVARGALTGARGNSGVILSQILQGFAYALAGKDRATAADIALALETGSQHAYRAVSEPVEGTILTVARSAAEAARFAAERSGDLPRLGLYVYRRALDTVILTPEMLPVLKEAGVVDAGGKGFAAILEGILQIFKRYKSEDSHKAPFDFEPSDPDAELRYASAADIKFTYCTEFIIQGQGIPLEEIKQILKGYGDCMMVVGNSSTAKVHIHSNNPGRVIESCLLYGSLHQIQVNNMLDQHQELQRQQSKPMGIVAVALGEGIEKILESLGVDVVINGGQTMNPSAEEIVKAIERVTAENVFVLPNNKNIILAVQQAQQLTSKNVAVIPTCSIPQGFAALLAVNADADFTVNTQQMQEASANVLTGEVTRAARDAVFNGLTITEGEFIGIAEGTLMKGSNLMEAVLNVCRDLVPRGELTTLYYGLDVPGKEAEAILERLVQTYPEVEFELYYGGQPLYHFLISVE
ncbi:MAG: DAK2 domain-containing protein [Clostridia bacterium]|nr:DAK2 domain-containing protein [Clostridia bacterium]